MEGAGVLESLLGGELPPTRNIHFRPYVCKKHTSILFELVYNFELILVLNVTLADAVPENP